MPTTDELKGAILSAVDAYGDAREADGAASRQPEVDDLTAQVATLTDALDACRGEHYDPPPTDDTPATLKPRVAGLVVTDPAKLDRYNGVIKHAMLKSVTWADVEPTQGNYDFSAIRRVLDALPDGAYLKVVVDSGTHAPNWVKAWGSVDVVLSRAGTHGQVPFFWTPQYVEAYNALQDAMAAEFDADPRLKQVVYAGTMTENSEPFTLGGDDASGQRLAAAGFTWDAEKATMRQMLEHMLTVWPTTRVELALHGAWQYATDAGIKRGKWADIEAFVDPLVTKYGSHLLTADYGLGPNDGPPDQPYAYMAARGADSGYQLTVGKPYNADTRAQAVKNAIDMGGSYCEHAAFSDGDGMTLQQQNDALVANSKEN